MGESERDSVLDCVRQAWARRRFRQPDNGLSAETAFTVSKAVSPMQVLPFALRPSPFPN